MRTRRPRLLAAALAAALASAACSSDDGQPGSATAPASTTVAPPTTAAPTTTTAAPVAPELAYAEAGPFPVGYVDLVLPDGRGVAVWYPAPRPGSRRQPTT